MRKILILLYIVIVYQYSCYCQSTNTIDSNKVQRNSVFLEIGGNSTVYSINYDYLLTVEKYFKTALTIGLSGYKGSPYPDIELSPQFNLLIGGKLCAEIGVGYTKSLTLPNGFAVLRLGIRYQKPKGGIFGRFAFTPLFKSFEGEPFLPWIGLSVGYTFKCHCKKKN
jgi:hypothetical protein